MKDECLKVIAPGRRVGGLWSDEERAKFNSMNWREQLAYTVDGIAKALAEENRRYDRALYLEIARVRSRNHRLQRMRDA